MKRSRIQISEILLEYDGPQIVLAKDLKNVNFICVAVPDEQEENLFFGSRIDEEHISQFRTSRIDLYYALTNERRSRHISFSFDGSSREVIAEEFKDVVPQAWYPERGFFLELDAVAAVPSSVGARDSITIKVDGRWDLEDLSDFPQKLSAPYAFMFSLRHSRQLLNASTNPVFQRYPWRGGFSTVNFFRDLYDRIPNASRVLVKKIQYASPGTISVQASKEIMDAVHRAVRVVDSELAYRRYQDLRRGMTNRNLLGRSNQEVDIDSATEEFLRIGCEDLADAIAFQELPTLHEQSGGSWYISAKYLLAYYRRLDELAQFYSSGKAQYVTQ
ncbi:hypothetical protein [Massilia haematophila]|uniref:Uncharacterized protein n=1 Tax=Massilia haematophila TaxID=457923 RepID=A0ABV7PNU2_9BURK